MTKIKKELTTTVRITKLSSQMLARVAEMTHKNKETLINEYIKAIYQFTFLFKTCNLEYMITSLPVGLTITPKGNVIILLKKPVKGD